MEGQTAYRPARGGYYIHVGIALIPAREGNPSAIGRKVWGKIEATVGSQLGGYAAFPVHLP